MNNINGEIEFQKSQLEEEEYEIYEGGDPDDVDNIDFNNYKGIYADDEAG